jgi:hypothetical protein
MIGPFAYPGWFWIFVVGFVAAFMLIGSMNSRAAIHPDATPAVIRPEMARNADRPTCVQTTTVERFAVSPGGKWKRLAGPVTMLTVCEQ